MSNPTFRQDVDGLTQYLQAEYELTIVEDTFELVDGWKCGHETLANKFVRIRFVAGAPRDQFVDVSILSPKISNASSRIGRRSRSFIACSETERTLRSPVFRLGLQWSLVQVPMLHQILDHKMHSRINQF